MRPSRIELDGSALINNLNVAKRLAPNSKVVAMVKANAYGHGLEFAVRLLGDKVSALGVACIEEAIAIRQLGIKTDVVLFEGFFASDELLLIEKYDFQVAIHNEVQLQQVLTHPWQKPITVWIKINTGMNRLGFKPLALTDVHAAVRACKNVGNIRIMTHFAQADELNVNKTPQQIEEFLKVAKPLDESLSLANSAGILGWKAAHADFIRPGIMLYGSSPFFDKPANQLGLQSVMHFNSGVIALHQLFPGQAVGYGAKWQAKRKSTIAVVAVGYGDGYPRVVGPSARVFINGCYAPLVGRVSMDMLTIDVTDVPNTKLGDAVELWGKHVCIDEVANHAGTIGYELMCKVTSRVLGGK